MRKLPYILIIAVLAAALGLSLSISPSMAAGSCATTTTTAAPVTTTTTVPSSTRLLKIMALGDSITAADRVPGGYRIELEKRLKADGLRYDFVGSLANSSNGLSDPNHEGHSGYWTQGLETGYANNQGNAAQWISTYKPDVVLLMSGTNNIMNDGEATAEPTQDSLNATESLVNAILRANPSAVVVVGTIPPFPGKDQARANFNAGLQPLVNKLVAQGKKVRFADVGSTIYASDLADGVHPGNLAAYSRMGDAWYPAVKSIYTGS